MKTYKEFIDEDKWKGSYEEWIALAEKLAVSMDKASDALKDQTPNDLKGGLVPDEIKSSSGYVKAKKAYDKAFKLVQNHNKDATKGFLKRRSTDYREHQRRNR